MMFISRNFLKIIYLGVVLTYMAGCQDDPYVEPGDDGDGTITPKSAVRITAIRLNSFPLLDPNGNTWDMIDTVPPVDLLGDPDIMFNLSDFEPQPLVFWSQESHFSNVKQTDSVVFILLDPYRIEPLDTYYSLNIYDFDVPDSTKMGFVTFYAGPYPDPDNPYPTSVLINENGFSVIVGLAWEE
jgi:hypothetical protein